MLPCPAGSKQYLVRASYLEIYNEDIRDLLSKNPTSKLEMKENQDKGVYVKDLKQFTVNSRDEINSVLQVKAPSHTHTQHLEVGTQHDDPSCCRNDWSKK